MLRTDRSVHLYQEGVEALCIEAGLPPAIARARAEDLVVRVEGALVVCAGTGDHGVFARTLEHLRSSLLAPVSASRASR